MLLKAGTLATLALAPVVFAQPPARPQFDVASIKPSEDHGMMYVRPMPGGRLLINAPARLMLMNAYGLQFSQLAGGPDWLASDIWSVDARAAGNPTREELMLMLQALLEERFHLKVHHETREMPVYALTAGKSPKMPTAREGACATPVPGQPEPAAPPCGRVRMSMSPEGVLLEGGSAPISELVRVLAAPLQRPVVDRTALSGVYDIVLKFTRDAPGGAAPADNAPPGIFTAIEEQLGLKLTAAKAPIDILVIDRIERPSAN